MKTRHLIAVSTLALIAGTSAQAADTVRMHADPVPVIAPSHFAWDGFYAGGEIGGSWARNKSDKQQLNRSMKSDGFIGGLYTGYNFAVGNNIVLGAETDFLWSKVDGKHSQLADENLTRAFHVKQKWVGSTRARLGYAVDRLLPYAAAGVAYSKINTAVNSVDAEGVAGEVHKVSKTRTGWTGGAGVDYAMADNLLLRVEYRYTDFGKKNFMRKENASARISHKANDFRVGVAYKF